MPELGKATYFLVADTRQFDVAMAHADEVSAASSTTIGRSMDKATASVGRLGASAGAGAGRVAAAEGEIATAATASSVAVQKAHAAMGRSYVSLSKTGTHVGESMKIGPLAAVAVTLYEGIKTFKENANAAALLAKAYDNAGVHAHTTRGELARITEELEKNTLASRATIQGILALSLGFREVADKGRFAQTVLDVAALTHKDAATIAKAYGKALEDPATGLSKLARAGLAFSPAQKAMAKTITETNGALAGQAYVSKLVESRTRGMAKAAADNAPWIQLFKQFKEIAATFVTVLLPGFKAILGVMDAHRTSTKILVGTLVGLAAIYVTIHGVQKVITMTTHAMAGAQALYARVTGATAAAEMERARAARVAAVAEAELNTMTEAAVANTTALQFAADKAAVSMGRLSAAELEASAAAGATAKGKAGLLGLINPANVATVAVLATAAAFIYMGKSAYDAWQNMKKSQASVASDQNVALTAYAHEVNTLVKGGMDKISARVKADADVFKRLGIHVGKTFVDGVGKSIGDGATALQQKITEVMKGLAKSADDANVQLQAALTHGAPKEILDQLSQAASDAAYDASVGAQGAAAAVRAAHEKILADHKAWVEKMKGLAQDSINDLIDSLSEKLGNAKSKLASSFGALSDVMFRAFDASTEAGLRRFDTALQKFNDKIDKAMKAANKKMDEALRKANSSLDTYGAALTPAEAALKALQDKQAATGRAEALADAQGQLSRAKTPGEIAAAQRAVRDAQLAIQMAQLEQQAAIERAAKNREVDLKRQELQEKADAEREAYAAQMERAQKAYAARIEQAQRDYASERELYRNHLQLWLQQELVWLQKHPGQWRRVFRQLTAVFGPDVKAAGRLIGRGFIQQFRDAVNDTAKKALVYNAALANATQRLGRALADGIVGGMATLAPKLYREMLIQVNKAMKQFGIAYGVKSPSTKTRDDIGKPLGQGIVVGFKEAVQPLQKPFSLGTATLSGAAAYGQNVRIPARTLSIAGQSSGYNYNRTSYPGAQSGGSLQRGERPNVQVVQNIKRVDPDPFQLAKEAQFAADGVFG